MRREIGLFLSKDISIFFSFFIETNANKTLLDRLWGQLVLQPFLQK